MVDSSSHDRKRSAAGDRSDRHRPRRGGKKKIVCLESKADRDAASLRTVADELMRRDPSRFISRTDYGFTVASPTDDLQQVVVPSCDVLVALLQELRTTRETLATLDRRLRVLGID